MADQDEMDNDTSSTPHKELIVAFGDAMSDVLRLPAEERVDDPLLWSRIRCSKEMCWDMAQQLLRQLPSHSEESVVESTACWDDVLRLCDTWGSPFISGDPTEARRRTALYRLQVLHFLATEIQCRILTATQQPRPTDEVNTATALVTDILSLDLESLSKNGSHDDADDNNSAWLVFEKAIQRNYTDLTAQQMKTIATCHEYLRKDAKMRICSMEQRLEVMERGFYTEGDTIGSIPNATHAVDVSDHATSTQRPTGDWRQAFAIPSTVFQANSKEIEVIMRHGILDMAIDRGGRIQEKDDRGTIMPPWKDKDIKKPHEGTANNLQGSCVTVQENEGNSKPNEDSVVEKKTTPTSISNEDSTKSAKKKRNRKKKNKL